MREIKFRAFYDGSIWIVGSIDFRNNGFECRLLKTDQFAKITEVYVHSKNGVILLQFTGLKDKNGKEIYEGDIMKQREVIKVVRYNTKECSFDLHFEKGPGFRDNIQYFLDRDGEVIGNIYESVK